MEPLVRAAIYSNRFANHLVDMAPDVLQAESQGPGRGHSIFITHKRRISEALQSQFVEQGVDKGVATNLAETASYETV